MHLSLSLQSVDFLQAGKTQELLQQICPSEQIVPPQVSGSFEQYASHEPALLHLSVVVEFESLHSVSAEQAILQSVHSAVHVPGLMHFCPVEQFASVVHVGIVQALLQQVVPVMQLTSVGQFVQFSFVSIILLPQLARQSLSFVLLHPIAQ